MVFTDSLTKAGRLLEIQRTYRHCAARRIGMARITFAMGTVERSVLTGPTRPSSKNRLPTRRHEQLAGHLPEAALTGPRGDPYCDLKPGGRSR